MKNDCQKGWIVKVPAVIIRDRVNVGAGSDGPGRAKIDTQVRHPPLHERGSYLDDGPKDQKTCEQKYNRQRLRFPQGMDFFGNLIQVHAGINLHQPGLMRNKHAAPELVDQ